MFCNPTLTAEEFKQVHNGLCNLDMVVQRLEDSLHPDLFVKLRKAANEIRSGLKGAYDQDREVGDRKYNHYSAVREQRGLKSIWSIYDVESLSIAHPFVGAKQVVYKDHWGEKETVAEIKGFTWADLYVAADRCIRESNDSHHSFIERFNQSSINPEILFLYTGS